MKAEGFTLAISASLMIEVTVCIHYTLQIYFCAVVRWLGMRLGIDTAQVLICISRKNLLCNCKTLRGETVRD